MHFIDAPAQEPGDTPQERAQDERQHDRGHPDRESRAASHR